MAFPQQFLTVIDQPAGATLEAVMQDGNHQSIPLVPLTSIVTPLTAFWWVDAASTATTPDGSEARPYPNVADAITAAAAATITNLTLFLVPGLYTGTTTIDSQAAGLVKLTLGSPGMRENGPILENLVWTPITAGGSQLTLQGVGVQLLCIVDDALVGPGQALFNVDTTNVGVFNSAGNVTVRIQNAVLAGDNTTLAYGVVAHDSEVGIGTVGAGGVQAWDSQLTFVTVDGDTHLTGCDFLFNGPTLTLAGGAQVNIWSGSTFNGGGGTIAFTAPGLLHLDGSTNYWHAASSSGITNGEIIVSERPQRATISVAVPALATDELGYVNVTTAGTPLAGLLTTDLVGFNPADDVETAGAGNGGPINARVSAADTIRVAFMGATTAHAVDFVFYKI